MKVKGDNEEIPDSRESISNKYLCKLALKKLIEDENRIFSRIEFQKEII